MKNDSGVITLEMMRQALYTAVVCDVLDSLGFPRQSPPVSLQPLSGDAVLIGRAKTTLWSDMVDPDPSPYELELQAVDACQPDDVPHRGGRWIDPFGDSGRAFIDRRAKPRLPRRDRRRVRA